MKLVKNSLKIFIAGVGITSACGRLDKNPGMPQDLSDQHQKFEQKNAEVHEKWLALLDYLKLPDHQSSLSPENQLAFTTSKYSDKQKANSTNKQVFEELSGKLSKSSGLFEPGQEQNFQGLLKAVAERFNSTAYETRCAEITEFTKLPTQAYFHDLENPLPGEELLAIKDRSKTPLEASVYILKYRAQKNHAGEAETEVRAGLVVVPHKAPKNPSVIFYAHGNDSGLSYSEIASVIGREQENSIIVAPAYVGEPLCRDKIAVRTMETRKALLTCDAEGMLHPPTHVSVPWQKDVDDFMVIADCFSRTLLLDPEIKAALTSGQDDQGFFVPENEAAKSFFATIFPITAGKLPGFFGAMFQNNLKSTIVGTSRGGLVGTLALARAGAAWWVFSPVLVKANYDVLQASQDAAPILGKRYGLMPPMFDAIATLSAPTTVTMGRLKIILEQMVKGYGDMSLAAYLPGLQQLVDLDIFADFRNNPLSEETLKNAAFEIVSRDLPFLAPLAFGALKDNSVMDPDRIGQVPGSILICHSKEDKIVPFEQATIGFNALTLQGANKTVQKLTSNQSSPQIQAEILEYRNDLAQLGPKKFHIDDGFWLSQASLQNRFVDSKARMTFLYPLSSKKGLKRESLPDQSQIAVRIKKIQEVARIFYQDQNLLQTEFSDSILHLVFSSEPSKLQLTEAQTSVIDYLISGGQHLNNTQHKEYVAKLTKGPASPAPRPAKILKDWFDRVLR